MKIKKASRGNYDDDCMLNNSSSDDDDVPLVRKKRNDSVLTRKCEDSLRDKKSRHSDDESDLSVSSDDDEPLVKKKRRDKDNLYSYSLERCAICDSVFHNKYNILVHNSQHIIIPLLKLQVHQCTVCSHTFASLDTLKHHKQTKHGITLVPDLLESIVYKQPVIKCIDDLSELLKAKKDLQSDVNKELSVENVKTQANLSLESLVKTQPIVKCIDDLSELLKAKKDLSVNKKPSVENLKTQANISLESLVKTQPIVKCIDDLSELLKAKKDLSVNKKPSVTQANINLESMVKTQPIVKCIDDLSELFKVKNDNIESVHKKAAKEKLEPHANISLESLVKTQPIVKCYDDLAELLKVKNENIDYVEEIIESDTDDMPNKCLENLVKTQTIVKCDNSVTELINNNIRSRLVFEDDIEDDSDDIITINDNFTKHRNGVLGMFNGLKSDLMKLKRDQPFVGKILLGSKIPGSVVTPQNFTASIHYDDLMAPGVYRCKRCSKTFPNRIQAIMHEATHMRIVKLRKGRPFLCSICDRYISGNYRNLNDHISEVHPHRKKFNGILTPCEQCGLKYHNYERHVKNYHTVYACPCGERFLTNKELFEHDITCDKEKKENVENNVCSDSFIQERVAKPCNDEDHRVLKLCEVCVVFKLYRVNVFKYVCVGELSEVGTRQKCESCDKEFFNIKLMKQIRRKRPEPDRSELKKSHCNTNENRLKHIQKRLKLLNKLTRF